MIDVTSDGQVISVAVLWAVDGLFLCFFWSTFLALGALWMKGPTTDDQRREASFIVPLLVLLWSKGNQVSACLSVI